jgi:hypothetical protein
MVIALARWWGSGFCWIGTILPGDWKEGQSNSTK